MFTPLSVGAGARHWAGAARDSHVAAPDSHTRHCHYPLPSPHKDHTTQAAPSHACPRAPLAWMISMCSHKLSACVQITPPGRTARCMASKNGCKQGRAIPSFQSLPFVAQRTVKHAARCKDCC